METQQRTGEGRDSPKEREKAFLPANARSRGFLPTWALPIGRAATDVPQLPGANRGGGGAAVEVGAARARSRGSTNPHSPLSARQPARPIALRVGTTPPPVGGRRAERASRDD
ncbi:hypothetical protein ACRRTK_024128 [Alexandromys fortis]